jgi:hypothetical protein
MNTNKNIARTMGILYIIGTVAGILSRVVTGSLLSAPDMLVAISANENRIVLGAFCVLTMGVVLTMIPVMAYPILKKHNETLALGYVVFRGALEGVTYMAIVVSWLLLLPLSQVYQAGTPGTINFQVWGNVLFESTELGVILMLVFGLGGLMFYGLLYQTKLVPRWLSVWGVIALLLNLVAGFAAMFGLFTSVSTISTVLQLPIFVQEMVLAVWLIVKGFKEVAA